MQHTGVFHFRGPRCFKVPSSPPFFLGPVARGPAFPATEPPLPCAQSARGDGGSRRSGPARSPSEPPCGRRRRSCTRVNARVPGPQEWARAPARSGTTPSRPMGRYSEQQLRVWSRMVPAWAGLSMHLKRH